MEKTIINVENASVCFDNKEVLHNINLQIKQGEKYFILGANGDSWLQIPNLWR